MAAQRRSFPSRSCQASWSLLKGRKLWINLVLVMSVITLLSLHHITTLQGRTQIMQQGSLRWRSRRALQMAERQAPRSFPPPQGNALVYNPRNAPPGRAPFFDTQNGRPPARIPDDARRLVPPPRRP